jgi:hypothetical protein
MNDQIDARRSVLLSLAEVYPNFADHEDIDESLSEPVLLEALDWLERHGLVERWERAAKATTAGATAVRLLGAKHAWNAVLG